MKKGFSLIELITVLLILAIIALITTPIVFRLIEGGRERTNEASLRGYVDSVRNAILDCELDMSLPMCQDRNGLFEVSNIDAIVNCNIRCLSYLNKISLGECTVNRTSGYWFLNGEVYREEPDEFWDSCDIRVR